MSNNKSKGTRTVPWDPKLHGGIVIYSNSKTGFLKACTYNEKGGADDAPAFVRAAVEARATALKAGVAEKELDKAFNWAIVHTTADSIYKFVLRAAGKHSHLLPGSGNVYVLAGEPIPNVLAGNSDVIGKIWPNKLEPVVHFGTKGWTPTKKTGMKFTPKFALLGD